MGTASPAAPGTDVANSIPERSSISIPSWARRTRSRVSARVVPSRCVPAGDNAAAESCTSTINRELVRGRSCATKDQARLAIFDYIECLYNLVGFYYPDSGSGGRAMVFADESSQSVMACDRADCLGCGGSGAWSRRPRWVPIFGAGSGARFGDRRHAAEPLPELEEALAPGSAADTYRELVAEIRDVYRCRRSGAGAISSSSSTHDGRFPLKGANIRILAPERASVELVRMP
jgi:hypothetical protein